MPIPNLKNTFAEGEALEDGAVTDTDSLNAITYKIDTNAAYIEMSAIYQIHQAFNTFRIEDDAGVALSNATFRGVVVEDFTDSSGKFNLIDTGAGTTAYFDTNHYRLENTPSVDNTSTELSEPGFETVATWTFNTVLVDGVTGTSAQSAAWGGKTGSQAWRGTFGGSSGGAGNTSVAYATKTITWDNVAAMTLDYSHTNSGTASNSTGFIGSNASYESGVGFSSTTSSDSATDKFIDTQSLTGSAIFVKACRNPNSGAATITLDVDDLKTYRFVTTSKTVKTNALTTTGDWASNITHVLVYLEYTASLKGTDTITVDISSDNGSTYTTGVALTTISKLSAGATASIAAITGFIPLTSTLGKQVMLKFNFSNSTGGSSAKLYRFGMVCMAAS